MSCPECPHCRATTEEALCESPVELAFLREIRKERMFDAFVPNFEVMNGRYRIDFAHPKQCIGIEIDGYEFHSDKKTFVNDRHRQRTLEIAGWRLIRFAAVEINEDVGRCVKVFREWLSACLDERVKFVAAGAQLAERERAVAAAEVRVASAAIDPAHGRTKLGGRAARTKPAP